MTPTPPQDRHLDTLRRLPVQLHASAEDRIGVIDALHRFAAGQDLGDAELFRSAFHADAILDFTQPAARLGVALPIFETRDGIAEAILPVVARLDTTHSVSNARVHVQGDRATLLCLLEAMHLPHGESGRDLLLKNLYGLELVRTGALWEIVRMTIRNVWWRGDPSVLFNA